MGKYKQTTMDPLGLYISVPFCRSKCTYCNFASGVFPESSLVRYTERLIEDIRSARQTLARQGIQLPHSVDTVYLGGGTPSTLPPDLLVRLFSAIRDEFEVHNDAEITLECAPGQISDAFLDAMLQVGVNRTSFGVQSFNDREAAVTGRLHTREIALDDLRRMQAAGIPRISVDLIAGLPYQTAVSWQQSLQTLIESGVTHASVYMLEIDEDSRLGRELLSGSGKYHAGSVPNEDLVADLYLQAADILARAGLPQYEISNFAQPGSESRHNNKYWRRQPYLGFGLDAHSMLRSEPQSFGQMRTQQRTAVRFETPDQLDGYLHAPAATEYRWLTPSEELEEAWFLGLRLNAGVSLPALRSEFGSEAIAAFSPVLSASIDQGLLQQDGDHVSLTHRGRLLSNEVFEPFLQAPQPSAFALEIT